MCALPVGLGKLPFVLPLRLVSTNCGLWENPVLVIAWAHAASGYLPFWLVFSWCASGPLPVFVVMMWEPSHSSLGDFPFLIPIAADAGREVSLIF